MLARIRAFFAERAVMEVETPLLSRYAATDPAIESLRVEGEGACWLQTSPEFPMKRLLAAGSGSIYQICKVFRGGERGSRHHPEFSLLEWYRPGLAVDDLIGEVAALVRVVLGLPRLPAERIAYRDLFRAALGIDPWSASPAQLREAALRRELPGIDGLSLDTDGWLDLLLVSTLESGLGRGRLTFLYHYPPSQAALARLTVAEVPVAERFELYLNGMELANGFHELSDAAEQRRRFERDLARRERAGQRVVPADRELLSALSAGLPDCSGVALGLDRLLMVAVGAQHIDEVLAFPVDRA
jgi:lysyl-tRNA synthetase class 2